MTCLLKLKHNAPIIVLEISIGCIFGGMLAGVSSATRTPSDAYISEEEDDPWWERGENIDNEEINK